MTNAASMHREEFVLVQKARSRAIAPQKACSTVKSMGDAANAHQRNIYNKKIPTLEYVDGQVR
jgi:hypothetical protein